jgi:hypothetical protein
MLLYNFDLIKSRILSSYIMISLLYHRDHIIWSISFSSIDLSSSIDSVNFRENHVILVIVELSYSRIVNDSLNLIRRTRHVALWHALDQIMSIIWLFEITDQMSSELTCFEIKIKHLTHLKTFRSTSSDQSMTAKLSRFEEIMRTSILIRNFRIIWSIKR